MEYAFFFAWTTIWIFILNFENFQIPYEYLLREIKKFKKEKLNTNFIIFAVIKLDILPLKLSLVYDIYYKNLLSYYLYF